MVWGHKAKEFWTLNCSALFKASNSEPFWNHRAWKLHQQLLKLTSIHTAALCKRYKWLWCIAGNTIKREGLYWSAALTRADAAFARSFLHWQGYSPHKLCNWQTRLYTAYYRHSSNRKVGLTGIPRLLTCFATSLYVKLPSAGKQNWENV